jgi:hypothetical protein
MDVVAASRRLLVLMVRRLINQLFWHLRFSYYYYISLFLDLLLTFSFPDQVPWNAYSIAAFSNMILCAWACTNVLTRNGLNSSTMYRICLWTFSCICTSKLQAIQTSVNLPTRERNLGAGVLCSLNIFRIRKLFWYWPS